MVYSAGCGEYCSHRVLRSPGFLCPWQIQSHMQWAGQTAHLCGCFLVSGDTQVSLDQIRCMVPVAVPHASCMGCQQMLSAPSKIDTSYTFSAMLPDAVQSTKQNLWKAQEEEDLHWAFFHMPNSYFTHTLLMVRMLFSHLLRTQCRVYVNAFLSAGAQQSVVRGKHPLFKTKTAFVGCWSWCMFMYLERTALKHVGASLLQGSSEWCIVPQKPPLKMLGEYSHQKSHLPVFLLNRQEKPCFEVSSSASDPASTEFLDATDTVLKYN